MGKHLKPAVTAVERGSWANKIEFVLSCIGLSVGIGNVWRYPYVAYENGGGTFQIPYVILLIFVGIPLYFMEIARGQFAQSGPIAVWASCPAGVGVGWAMIIVAIIGTTYYNVILSYTLVYMVSSFARQLPWAECSSWWGADDKCVVRTISNDSCKSNLTVDLNDTSCAWSSSSDKQSAPQQFWEKYVLDIGSANGVTDLGHLQWRLVVALFVYWFIVFLCVSKGVKSVGKVVYFTATFPYVILLALLIQGLLLDGALEGVEFFFTPQWNYLLSEKVWLAAAQQMVYSLSLANGALITLASYNNFRNKCHFDTFHVTSLDFLTSFLSSVVVFSVIGFLAKGLNVGMNSVFKEGQGLAFVIFPEVVSRLPVPQLWSFFFFFMLLMLGIDSAFAVIEAVWAAIFDIKPKLRAHQTKLYLVSVVGYFLSGLIYCTAGGQYFLNLIDAYNTMARTFLVAIEVVIVMWIYGLNRFCSDVELMIGYRPNIFFRICWAFICPVTIIALTIISWINFKPPTYGDYHYPEWAHAIGWLNAIFIFIQIPFWASIEVYKHWQRGNWRTAFQPDDSWGMKPSQEPDTQDTAL